MTEIEKLKIINYDLLVKQAEFQENMEKLNLLIDKNAKEIKKLELENENTQTDKDIDRVNDT